MSDLIRQALIYDRRIKQTQTTEGALASEEIVAYPMTNMSTVPSETFSPNREAMSSGGTAEPTFHVTMCTLEEDRNEGILH